MIISSIKKARRSPIIKLLAGFFIIIMYILYNMYLYAGAGSTSAEFLIVPVGSRPSALAGAFTGVADDINAVAYNPAGLGFLEDKEVSFMHSEWLIDTSYEYGAYAHPTQVGTFALSMRYVNTNDIVGRDMLGNKTHDFSAYDMAVNISYGRLITDVMAVGFSGIYINQKIDDVERSGGACDAGVLWECIPQKFYAGAAVQHVGPKLEAFETKEETLPTRFSMGIGYYAFEQKLLIASDIKKIIHSKPVFCAGIEYAIGSILKLRSGIEAGSEKEKALMWTSGMGFSMNGYAIDYAYEPFGDLDTTHRFTFTARF